MKSDEIDRRDIIKTIALGSATILPLLRHVEQVVDSRRRFSPRWRVLTTPGTYFPRAQKRTLFAYYTSAIGTHQELNYQGHQCFKHWPDCPSGSPRPISECPFGTGEVTEDYVQSGFAYNRGSAAAF